MLFINLISEANLQVLSWSQIQLIVVSTFLELLSLKDLVLWFLDVLLAHFDRKIRNGLILVQVVWYRVRVGNRAMLPESFHWIHWLGGRLREWHSRVSEVLGFTWIVTAIRYHMQNVVGAVAGNLLHHLLYLLPISFLWVFWSLAARLLDNLLDYILLLLFWRQLLVILCQKSTLPHLSIYRQKHRHNHNEADNGDDGVDQEYAVVVVDGAGGRHARGFILSFIDGWSSIITFFTMLSAVSFGVQETIKFLS